MLSVEVYINKQQIYNSNGLYLHKSYFSIIFKVTKSEYKSILNCDGYDFGDFFDDLMAKPLSDLLFTMKLKMLIRPDRFMLYG